MDKYIGIDAHASSCTIVVIGPSGRKLSEQVVETNATALVECIRSISRPRPSPRPFCSTASTCAKLRYGDARRSTDSVSAQDSVSLPRHLDTRQGRLQSCTPGPLDIQAARYMPTISGVALRSTRRPTTAQDRRRETARDRVTPISDQPHPGDMPRPGTDSCSAHAAGGSDTRPLPHRSPVLVILQSWDHDAQLFRLGAPRQPLGTSADQQDSWSVSDFQPHPQVCLQGSGDDHHYEAARSPTASALRTHAKRRHQTEPRQTNAGPPDCGHDVGDVETPGAIRPSTASEATTNARLSTETVGSRAVRPYVWHFSQWRAGFEGEHPCISWPVANSGKVPRLSYAPSEYQKKQWLSEARIERWPPHVNLWVKVGEDRAIALRSCAHRMRWAEGAWSLGCLRFGRRPARCGRSSGPSPSCLGEPDGSPWGGGSSFTRLLFKPISLRHGPSCLDGTLPLAPLLVG
jgi:hypothetical protein